MAHGEQITRTNSCQIVTVEGEVTVHLSGFNGWQSAKPGQWLQAWDQLRTEAESRATVRFSDLSVLRVNELTTFGILPPSRENKKPILDLKSGSLYFFSREKPAEIQFQTPTAAGAIRGTEFNLEASNESTLLALIDGEVDLGNEMGQIELKAGELGRVSRGQMPVKTPFIDAINIIQWCLYYPAVVDVNEIDFTPEAREKLRDSLAAYTSGDLLKALALFRTNQVPASEGTTIYEAALDMSVGRVDRAVGLLEGVKASNKPAIAMREMIAAVQGKPWKQINSPSSASEWLAHSYYLQSQAKPEEALRAAHSAAGLSPSFGFAWVRVAELELGLARMSKARAALRKGVQLSPRNAQALTVQGFLSAAQGHMTEAQGYFEQAIAIDGALGNAWLGHGLCRIRRGDEEGGREDLQVAATLEPQRALLRSYLAKAFDNAGMDKLAQKDLRMAKKLDPKDPTAWLYSALLNDRLNRVNDAVADLEKSKELNDNQRLFRSRLLLDQDQAVREANLALIYADAGMPEVGTREAAKAVNNDYANYSAHLFLANSYDSLRDPTGFNQRYDSAAISEWFIANLLAPVGTESLSRNVAAREYSPFFVTDGLGFGSSTEYDSRGMWTESASQYGQIGKMAYDVDSYYRTDPGQRVNDDFEQQVYSVQTKVQITESDSLFLYANYFKGNDGDVAQRYNQTNVSPDFRVNEAFKEPNLYLGWHHEWEPGVHTLFLAGRMTDELDYFNPQYSPLFLYYRFRAINPTNRNVLPYSQDYKINTKAYSEELQQIFETGDHTFIFGGRLQEGDDRVSSSLTPVFGGNLAEDFTADLNRYNLYGYDQWRVIDPVQLTLGLAYERVEYPLNLVTAPLSNESSTKSQVAPKLGVVYTPWKGGALRAHYTRSLGGDDTADAMRLEPTMVGGLNQTFRSLFPEAVAGTVPVSEFETWSAGIDQAFASGTYLGVEAQLLQGNAARSIGVLTNSGFVASPDSVSSQRQTLDYEEKTISFSANQLLGREWSVGINEKISQAELKENLPDLSSQYVNAHVVQKNQKSLLNQLSFSANYNHPCGFFMQYQALWTLQDNMEDVANLAGDNFWQHNVFAGYRFFRRHAEVQVGILNLADQDYQLYPLNLYAELPRNRTFVASFKFYF